MIHFFARHSDTLTRFMDSWAPELRPHLRRISYHRALFLRSPPPGVCIFTDFERLRRWTWPAVRRLKSRVNGQLVLNNPDRHLSRFQLLRTLNSRGINAFQVHRVNDLNGPVKFPVFLRSEVDHRGAITDWLHSREDVERALSGLSLRNLFRRKHLVAIEYCDSSDGQGIFRKYSAMNVNGTLIPRHVLFSRNWVTKHPDMVNDATVEEELDFIERFPHRDELAAIFRIAGVDYGRVDYGVKDGRIQVWEINTNPIIVPRRHRVNPKRLASQTQSARRIAEALMKLACDPQISEASASPGGAKSL